MARVPKVYFICGMGLGSSLACQMEAEDVFNAAGVEVNCDHESISMASSVSADIIVSGSNFKSQYENITLDPNTKLIFLDNVVDKEEIKEKVLPVVQEVANED